MYTYTHIQVCVYVCRCVNVSERHRRDSWSLSDTVDTAAGNDEDDDDDDDEGDSTAL